MSIRNLCHIAVQGVPANRMSRNRKSAQPYRIRIPDIRLNLIRLAENMYGMRKNTVNMYGSREPQRLIRLNRTKTRQTVPAVGQIRKP